MADSVITSEVDRAFRRAGITGDAAAVLMIVFGILIIAFPQLLVWLIGIYLIVVGILQLLGRERARSSAPPP